MSFLKLYKVCQDSPVGYQTINQVAANSAEMRTQMYVQHGDEEAVAVLNGGAGGSGINWSALGRHDLDEIPRSVAYALVYAQSPTVQSSQMRTAGPGIPSIFKIGDGDYLVPVLGLSKFWARVSSLGDDATKTWFDPVVRPFFPTAANNYNSGLRITTLMLDAGDFVPTDSSFAIALYGTP